MYNDGRLHWVHTMASSGTISQTLVSIAQTAEGQQLLNALIHGTAVARGDPFGTFEAALFETGYGASAMSWIEIKVLTGEGIASDELTYEVITPFHDTAIASGDVVHVSQTTTLVGLGFAKSMMFEAVMAVEHHTANATSSMQTGVLTTLTSTAIASDEIFPGITYNEILSSTAHASSEMVTGGFELVVDTANAYSETTHFTVSHQEVAESATAASLITAWALANEELAETALGSSSFSFEGSFYNETLTSVAIASDWLWAKDFGAVAWVLNTQSGGITNYNNFGFTSIAFHSGKLYATSPEGLFQLGADDDDGRKIDAEVKGGFLDFGVEEKKRVSDIFVGYTGGDLECDVETYDGPEEVYTYDMEYRDADAPRNNRLKVGRGLSSRYWRLSFRNVNGADFQIHDVTVEVAASKRRL
jgi:hypothetical protein